MKCPYKDATPEDTISKIRTILIQKGFFTTEINWKSSMDKVFSCSVKLDGLPFQVNGKGLSAKYALASAYGEFMERLQTFFIYSGCKFSPVDKDMYGFYLSVDEKRFEDFESCLNQLPVAFKKSYPFTSEDNESLYDFWKHYVTEISTCQDIVFLPYL